MLRSDNAIPRTNYDFFTTKLRQPGYATNGVDMASIRRVGKKYLAEVRRKGNYKSKRFDSKAEAQGWALDMEAQMGAGIAAGHLLSEAMQRYSEEVSPSRKGAKWEQIRLKKLERDPIANIMLEHFSRDDIMDWMERQTISPASIRRELNLLSAVLREARVTWRWMTHNPMQDVRLPQKSPPRDRLISDKERDAILRALEYEENEPVKTSRQIIAVAFLIALETAMRRGEIWGLDWERIHLQRRFVTLPETKNGSKRDVPLSARAVELFEKLRPKESGRVFDVPIESGGQIFRRAVKLAGIEGLTFHDARHTAITRLARKLDMLDLARMVGHRDPRSLTIYYNATAEDIASRLD